MPSNNALRDIIYRDPIGTETMTGMQSATPIDEYANLHRALQMGLPIAMGFGGGTSSEYQSLSDYIKLLNSLRVGMPEVVPGEWNTAGTVAASPLSGKASVIGEPYTMGPFYTGMLRYVTKSGNPYPLAYDKAYEPIETAVDRLMSKLYPGWETEK